MSISNVISFPWYFTSPFSVCHKQIDAFLAVEAFWSLRFLAYIINIMIL